MWVPFFLSGCASFLLFLLLTATDITSETSAFELGLAPVSPGSCQVLSLNTVRISLVSVLLHPDSWPERLVAYPGF